MVSKTLKYVYVAYFRTSSKSMYKWLKDNYQGEWYGKHHQFDVPNEFRDYLVFTVVRNPYEREVSSRFFVSKMPDAPPRDLNKVKLGEFGWQKRRLKEAGVSLVLHFERLPECLGELPFVDENNIPPFPHVEEAGYRPFGNFFDHFTMEDEKVVWEYAREDFEAFGYRRFDCGLPETWASEGLFFTKK